jgi:hypothetical protein
LIAELVAERPSLLLEYVGQCLGAEQQDKQRHHDERVWTPES